MTAREFDAQQLQGGSGDCMNGLTIEVKEFAGRHAEKEAGMHAVRNGTQDCKHCMRLSCNIIF